MVKTVVEARAEDAALRRFHLAELHAGQVPIWESAARFRVVACGRRFGKTELGKRLILLHALMGEQCWWLAPTYRMAEAVWRDVKRMTRPLKPDIEAQDRRLTLPDGGSITIRSTHVPDVLRGAGLDYAVLDEAAYMTDEIWPEVVRPMLMDRRGGAAFLSTPNGFNGFWVLYQLGLDGNEPEWESFRAPSSANPMLDPLELESIRRVTPERVFRAEYLAEFVDDANAVFREVSLRADAPLQVERREGVRYVAGCDWGRADDYTAVVVIDAETCQMVAMERYRGLSWEVMRARVAEMCKRWSVSRLWAEENAVGAVNIELLAAADVPVRAFVTTAKSKPALIDGLAIALERGELRVQPEPVLLEELSAYRMMPSVGGGYKYSAPSGGHDDTVIALALAWHGVRQGRFTIDWV